MNVSIKEGNENKIFGSVNYLKTKLYAGGTTDWVPEEDRRLTSKWISKNGTYLAQEEKDYNGNPYYGFDVVDVDILEDELCGWLDGDFGMLSLDDGNLNFDSLPTRIEVDTPPTKTTYINGETIDFSGLVVKAYTESGELWTDTKHPNGVIPFDELTPSTTIAGQNMEAGKVYHAGRRVEVRGEVQHQDRYEREIEVNSVSIGPVFEVFEFTAPSTIPYYRFDYTWQLSEQQFGLPDFSEAYLDPTLPAFVTVSYVDLNYWTGVAALYIVARSQPFTGPSYSGPVWGNYTKDGKTVYYVYHFQRRAADYGSVSGQMEYYVYHHSFKDPDVVVPLNKQFILSPSIDKVYEEEIREIAWSMAYSANGVALQWGRPGDGATLETSFQINVI